MSAIGYPTAADLIAGSTGEARQALDSFDADQQQALLDGAIVSVEEFCRQSFATAEVLTRSLDGSGGSLLQLDRRLARLDSIEVHGVDVGLESVTLSDDCDELRMLAPNRDTSYTRLMGSLDPDWTPERRIFTWGRNTVTVAGAWGWLEVPDAVVYALRRDMEDVALADTNGLSSTIRAYRALGVRDVRQGNLSVSMLNDVPTLPVDAQRRLTPLVWTDSGLLG